MISPVHAHHEHGDWGHLHPKGTKCVWQ